MSVLGEAHLSPLRGGYGLELGLSPPSLPSLWRPSLWPCQGSTCPCVMSRSYVMTDLFDYMASTQAWPPWYMKSHVVDPLYRKTPPPPPPPLPPPPLLDLRESPCKELPTKLLKHERLKDRQDLSQTLNFDKDHASRLNSKKCAGTQTSISSVSADLYVNGDAHCKTDSYSMRQSMHTQPSQHCQGMPIRNRSPPQYTPLENYTPMDTHDAPLNLSISSSSSNQHQARPSVITCASSTGSGNSNGSDSRYGNGMQHSPSRREVSSVGICDPAIEEHFRRSLGKDYPEFLSSKQGVTSSFSSKLTVSSSSVTTTTVTTESKGNSAVSITGDVDDHFAKSLGDSTWSAIKAKNDSFSVDDHFAKALGDTWLRIKAEKEGQTSSNSPPHASIVST